MPYKLAAFCIAGAFGGLAGALFVQHERFISPSNVSFEISALALIMVIIGGAGTLYGPVLGALFVVLMRDELSARFGERWELVLGLVFVAFVYVLPKGIGGMVALIERRWGKGALTPQPPLPILGEGEPRSTLVDQISPFPRREGGAVSEAKRVRSASRTTPRGAPLPSSRPPLLR